MKTQTRSTYYQSIDLEKKVASMAASQTKTSRNLIVDLLIIVFGISSWVAVNGLWVELPVLVNSLPESWQLASYVIITSQVANLGPVLFSAARKIWSQKVLEVPTIHASLFVVTVACALLAAFWDRTTVVAGNLHSTALLVLTFFLAFVDCTSSLLFLPFVANFKEHYVVSYLAGSGLSGPIPGLVALAQGAGGYASCRNVSSVDDDNVTTWKVQEYHAPPRFSVNVFFAFLCGQMIISWVAFLLLTKLPAAKKERVSAFMLFGRNEENLTQVSLKSVSSRPSVPSQSENFQSSVDQEFENSGEKTASSEEYPLGSLALSKCQYSTLLLIQGYVSTLMNGVLLSIQTYSCLPYGSLAFHLTATLSSISNPVCCFVAMFLPISSVKGVLALAFFFSSWAAYILATALLSPTPPLVNTDFGAFLVVLSWVLVSGSVAYIKACVASILRKAGGQVALYRCGVVTQVGSAIGAVTTFLIIQYTSLFNSFSPCNG